MQFRSLLLTAAGAAALSTVAFALPASAQSADEAVTRLDDVVVTGLPLGRTGAEVGGHVAILQGDELAHRRQATLGETLNGIPGVNSDTFGAGSSRPVIRGQTAPRVKVLSDGAGLLDASEISPDHAVSGEPLLLNGIEILRGPAALLYGGSAIGGAVNLLDKKIPTAIPANGGEGVAEVRLGSADDEEAGVVGMTVGAGNIAVHVEAAARKTSDYKLNGWDEDRLDGSFTEGSSAAIGLSWIGSRGYIGAAYSEQNSRYGLPGHSHEYESCHPHGSSLHCGGHDHGDDDHDHDHDHEHEHEEAPIVDLKSRRVDLRGEIRDPFAGIERIRFRGGYNDYRHHEIEHGEIATTFENEGYDSRVEVQHAPIAGIRGAFGVQTSRSDFSATGVESFLPETRTDNTGVFLFEEYTAGDIRFEGAIRQEWQDATGVGKPDVSHDPLSLSAAAIWSFAPEYSASLSVSRSQRAPTVQELYARGVHLATNTYEIGDANLDVETATSVELGLKKTDGRTTFTANAYHTDYDGYIYGRTLDQFEDFRLIRYSQEDATFTGVEGEIRHDVNEWLNVGVFGDYVRAKFKDEGDLPRIPAARLGARAAVASGPWHADAEYYHVFDQKDVAAFETATPGYEMVNATVAYDFDIGNFQNQLFVRGTNLLDEEARNHASFIVNAAPLRGRNFVIGLRTAF